MTIITYYDISPQSLITEDINYPIVSETDIESLNYHNMSKVIFKFSKLSYHIENKNYRVIFPFFPLVLLGKTSSYTRNLRDMFPLTQRYISRFGFRAATCNTIFMESYKIIKHVNGIMSSF